MIINSYSSRTRRIWADVYQLISGKYEKNNCFRKILSNSLDFFGWNLLKSWHFLYRRRREKFFSDLQNFSTRNSPSVFPYLVKLNDNGSHHGLREPIRKLENHLRLNLVSFFTFKGFSSEYVAGMSIQMPLFFRLPVTSTEICLPCFNNKWNTRSSVNGACPTICDVPICSWTRTQYECGVDYQGRVAYTHTCEINSFVDTVRPNSQN